MQENRSPKIYLKVESKGRLEKNVKIEIRHIIRTKQRKILDFSKVTGRETSFNYARCNKIDVHPKQFEYVLNLFPKVASKYASVPVLTKMKEVSRTVPRVTTFGLDSPHANSSYYGEHRNPKKNNI